jgi:molybdopterin-guanine dinucleotide biosynthesis protein A
VRPGTQHTGGPARPAAAPGPVPAFDAVVLAGGRGQRAGGPGKPGLVVAGRPLIAWVVAAAVGAGARRVVLVGPPWRGALAAQPQPPGGLVTVREEPPGGGPAAALRRGLAEVTAPGAAVLAADLPFLRPRHLRLLAAAALGGPDGPAGAVFADGGGQPQWLAGWWQTEPLRSALAAYGGASLGGLLGPLRPALVRYDRRAGEPPPWLDCDTPEDLRRAREWQAATGQTPAPPPGPEPTAFPPQSPGRAP